MNKLQAEFLIKKWIKKVERTNLKEMKTAAKTIKNNLGGIINYLVNKSTNTSLENFNRKLKSFLSREAVKLFA